jgi:hypothetical protein
MDRIGYLVAEYPSMPTENAPLAPEMKGQGFHGWFSINVHCRKCEWEDRGITRSPVYPPW